MNIPTHIHIRIHIPALCSALDFSCSTILMSRSRLASSRSICSCVMWLLSFCEDADSPNDCRAYMELCEDSFIWELKMCTSACIYTPIYIVSFILNIYARKCMTWLKSNVYVHIRVHRFTSIRMYEYRLLCKHIHTCSSWFWLSSSATVASSFCLSSRRWRVASSALIHVCLHIKLYEYACI